MTTVNLELYLSSKKLVLYSFISYPENGFNLINYNKFLFRERFKYTKQYTEVFKAYVFITLKNYKIYLATISI